MAGLARKSARRYAEHGGGGFKRLRLEYLSCGRAIAIAEER